MATISDDLAAAVTEGFRVARIDATNQDKLLSGPDDVEIELINGQKVTGPSWPKLSKLAQDADLAAFTILANQVHGDAQQVAVDKNAADASKAAAATSESNAKASENNAASAQSAAAASQGAAKTSENNSAASAAQAKTEADRAQSANPDNQLKKVQNLADLPDKAAAHTNLGLYFVQGQADATAGRIPTVGWNGWGASLPIPTAGSALTDIKVTSLFNASLKDTTDFPTRGMPGNLESDWGTVETFAYNNGTYGTQRVTIWQGFYYNHVFTRSWGPGAYTRWACDVSTRNFPLATEESTQNSSWDDDINPSPEFQGAGFRVVQFDDGNGQGAGSPLASMTRPMLNSYGLKIEAGAGLFGANIVIGSDSGGIATRVMYGNNAWGQWSYTLTDKNTAPDTNGFIKVASPIVKIFADGTAETNDESEGATVKRLDVGQYLIDGVLGMNNDPLWGGIDGGFELPKDRNGQALIWLDYEVKADGSILVKTYHRTYPNAPAFARNVRDGVEEGDPVDIPAGLFVSARVEMPHDSIYNKAQETAQKAMKEAGQLAAEEATRKATEKAQTDPDQPQS